MRLVSIVLDSRDKEQESNYIIYLFKIFHCNLNKIQNPYLAYQVPHSLALAYLLPLVQHIPAIKTFFMSLTYIKFTFPGICCFFVHGPSYN